MRYSIKLLNINLDKRTTILGRVMCSSAVILDLEINKLEVVNAEIFALTYT